MTEWLKGKKTYILAGVGVIYAASGWYLGKIDTQTMLEMAWAAMAAGTIRAGISNGR